ncbi:hypothetical protein M5D96_006438 [Drosophila gunungcola]|uniref:Uncharacterized protein n=1 Tax=Drosophila gunungcola TaxID=103775 RepID=A0A9P9YNY8_9MUSC|nr:hypothetical protein M5D96_006438 [Drosophila gunungcola]
MQQVPPQSIQKPPSRPPPPTTTHGTPTPGRPSSCFEAIRPQENFHAKNKDSNWCAPPPTKHPRILSVGKTSRKARSGWEKRGLRAKMQFPCKPVSGSGCDYG